MIKELSLLNSRLDKRYDIREELGRGSYAEIYLARDTLASPHSPHCKVVIKALNVFLQDDLDADLERTLVENFQNEAIALDRVRHPNIISRLGHGSARDLAGTVFHYLVLEHMPGGDMQQSLRRGRIPLERAFKYVEQVCSGLSRAHQCGVIHRDIKPHNLLLSADHETVKIADFGVARFSALSSPITRVGTNIYAPPEHSPLSPVSLGASTERLTPASDIYSLAKTIYTLFTHEAPRAFANSRIEHLPDEMRNEEWAPVFLDVMQRATADDPSERHQSVDEFWQDLSTIREVVSENEISTAVRSRQAAPQPHVARGYNPLVPEMPSFEAVSAPLLNKLPPAIVRREAEGVAAKPFSDVPLPGIIERDLNKEKPAKGAKVPVTVRRSRKGGFLRRVAAFAIFLFLFSGILYGTHYYMSRLNLLPLWGLTAESKIAIANTDVNLRAEPNTSHDPIGYVTKGSKVQVIRTADDWYQVNVVEQGRQRNSPLTATKGWLYGKFVDIED